MSEPRCICDSSRAELVQSEYKDYLKCGFCEVIVRKELLELSEERERYGQHQNSIEDSRYINFLQPAIDAALEILKPGQILLDYGCGPSPVLAEIIKRQGFESDYWDPCFFDKKFKVSEYDVITCTEVAEHFASPITSFKKLFGLLASGGSLVLETFRYDDVKDFEDWYYQRDPTHVCFYNRTSFEVLARDFGCSLKVLSESLSVFTKC